MNNYINQWAKIVLKESYRDNPDDYKADRLDIDAEKYERRTRDEHNLSREDMKNIEKTNIEERSADDILADFNKRKEEEKKITDSKIKTVEIEELYDGYVAGQITFASGKTEPFEHEISEEEMQDMFSKLQNKVKGKNVPLTIDDAAMAIVRSRLGDDSTDWLLGPAKTDIDDWEFEDAVDKTMINKKYDQDWAGVNGFYGDEYEPDESGVYNDYGSRFLGSYTDNHDSM